MLIFQQFWGNISAVIWRVCFALGLCICWPGPSGFLDRPNETEYTRMLEWLCHSLSPSFSLFCFSLGHVIFYHKFDCCIWTIAEVDIALHDNFLAASETFGHIFLFWELSISLSILPDLLCMPLGNFKFFTDWHKYNVMYCSLQICFFIIIYVQYAFGTNLMHPHYPEETGSI